MLTESENATEAERCSFTRLALLNDQDQPKLLPRLNRNPAGLIAGQDPERCSREIREAFAAFQTQAMDRTPVIQGGFADGGDAYTLALFAGGSSEYSAAAGNAAASDSGISEQLRIVGPTNRSTAHLGSVGTQLG